MVRDHLSLEEALSRILAETAPAPAVATGLLDALGGYLASPIEARCDSPRFDNSAVDGYAVRSSDLTSASSDRQVPLTWAGTVRAGDGAIGQLAHGTTVGVMTGAPVPTGADAVVMLEDVVKQDGVVRFQSPIKPGTNLRRRAEEYAEGTPLASQGDRVTPALIGLAAAAGHAELLVHPRPRVILMSTGDELVPPGNPLGPAQIWESNSFGLSAALASLGIRPQVVRVPDDPKETALALRQAAEAADLVITSGGVSVGSHDWVRASLMEIGAEVRFWGVRIKPGHPFLFATLGNTSVFGLPGNPVSALATYTMLVEPAIQRRMGRLDGPRTASARLTASLTKKPGRLEFVRGRTEVREGQVWVQPSPARGSHMIGGLAWADSLIHVPEEASQVEAGAIVELTWLPWRTQ